MHVAASIFTDFTLPNATSWFYLSLMLAVALFFKFSRLLSIRNWDVLTLFLLVPGLLLRQEARNATPETPEADRSLQATADTNGPPTAASRQFYFWGYLAMLGASAYFLFRCLFDLALVRRPALTPNLNLGGLIWLAVAIYVCLAIRAARPDTPHQEAAAKTPPALDKFQEHTKNLVAQETGAAAVVDAHFAVTRTLAMICHLSVVLALVIIGWLHFQDLHAGMAAGTLYLLLPYTAFQVGQWQSVWPVMLLLWAVATYRRPTIAGTLVGLAAGMGYYPVVVLPVWLSFYWGRGAGRFAGAFLLAVSLSLAGLGLILWCDGELAHSLQSALELSDWQPWKVPSAEGFWTGIHWAYRIPVFIAYVAFVSTTFFWPRPKNLAHLMALSAAALIGIQFWFADKGGVYVLWYLPLLLLLVFRPNLTDRLPPPLPQEADWLRRMGQRLARLGKRVLNLPEPVAQVQ